MVKILVLQNKATIWSPHGIIIMSKHREPPREVSPLRDRCSFETDDEYKQRIWRSAASSRRRYEIVNEIAPSVRVRSASASRLSGVRRLPPKQPPKQQPPRQPSSTRRGSVRQRSSGWQHSSSAHVHSLSAGDVPCRYGLQ